MTCKSCNTLLEQQCAPVTVKMVGGDLVFDGKCLAYTPKLKDGTVYGVTYSDGQVVGLITEPPEMNPGVAPCAPAPSNCPPGGGGGGVTVSPNPANLTTLTAQGIFTGLVVNGGNGVTVKGAGTVADPLVITGAGAGGANAPIYLGGQGISISQGSEPIISLDLKGAGGATGNSGNLTITDGLITNIADENTIGGVVVTGGNGVSVVDVNGNYQVSLENVVNKVAGRHTNGRQTVQVDSYGRVIEVQKDDALPVQDRLVRLPQSTLVFDGDGVLKQVDPTPNPTKQVFVVQSKGSAAVTGTIDITFPQAGNLLVDVASFGEGSKVEVSMLASDSLDWVSLAWAYPNKAVHRATTKTTTLRYTITPPTEGTRTPNAMIIVEYLGG